MSEMRHGDKWVLQGIIGHDSEILVQHKHAAQQLHELSPVVSITEWLHGVIARGLDAHL